MFLQKCLCTLIILLSLLGGASADAKSNEDAFFVYAFSALCPVALNELDILRRLAIDKHLQVLDRANPLVEDGTASQKYIQWAFPIEGRRYALAIDELPLKSGGVGKRPICALKSVRRNVDVVRKSILKTYQGHIKEISIPPQIGSKQSYSFQVRNYPPAGTFIILLSESADEVMAITASKIIK